MATASRSPADTPDLTVRAGLWHSGRAVLLLALALAGVPLAGQDLTSSPADPAGRLLALQEAQRDGLDPADYGIDVLLPMATDTSPDGQEEFRRRLDAAYRQYASDLAHGRTRPDVADPDWHIPSHAGSGAGVAAEARPPAHPQYERLRRVLNAYQAIESAGGWPMVAAGPELRIGLRDQRVTSLRERLRLTSDYDSEMQADPWFFDTGIDTAVRRFQVRHGIRATGVVDERTRDALNVAVGERIGQLEGVLERWRWLPSDLGPRYVWVNTASTMLQVMDNGRAVLTMKTIVGHPSRPTPSLAGELRQVVFNPTWSVPRTIAVEDLLPRQLEDGGYLTRHRIRVLAGGGPTEREVDPGNVTWQRLGPDYFPYRLRQDAGPGNSLGRVKLAMDNPFDIYLHDTPSRALFDLSTRTLGSGCVRLEDAAALTTLVLAHDRPWSEADTAERMGGGRTEAINLDHRLPVYIVYLTAWAGEDGVVHFRRDLYGRDARLLAARRGEEPGIGYRLTAK
jgi:murein L,D-transpeptidase YcbB/YkuD